MSAVTESDSRSGRVRQLFWHRFYQWVDGSLPNTDSTRRMITNWARDLYGDPYIDEAAELVRQNDRITAAQADLGEE